jgi:predicted DNA-binding protein YlxM (UPF0122 family)
MILELLNQNFSVGEVSRRTGIHKSAIYALRRGFQSYTEYVEYLAKRKGFKSLAEYHEDWAKRKGFKSLAEYHEDWAKRKGFKSPQNIKNTGEYLSL